MWKNYHISVIISVIQKLTVKTTIIIPHAHLHLMRRLSSKWKRRIKITTVTLILLLLIFGLSNILYVFFSTTVHTTDQIQQPVTILTYNLHGYDPIKGLQPAIELIEQLNADIMVLEEVFPTTFNGTLRSPIETISKNLNMTHYGQLSGDIANPSGVTIISRFPIVDEYKVKLPSYRGFTKYLIITTITTPMGNLTVAGTHLELPTHPKIQKKQATLIMNELNTFDKALFMCDCNAPDIIINPAYRIFANHMQDAWIADGHYPWQGNTWSTTHARLRVDYIWFKGSISVSKNSVHLIGTTKESDHYGLMAEIAP